MTSGEAQSLFDVTDMVLMLENITQIRVQQCRTGFNIVVNSL